MVVTGESVPPGDFGGLEIRDYTAGLDTSSSFAAIVVPPGAEHAESWSRRSDKYYYVASGTVEFTELGRVHALSAGDFCFVPKGEHFSYRNRTETPATLCLFHTPSFDLGSEVFLEAPTG